MKTNKRMIVKCLPAFVFCALLSTGCADRSGGMPILSTNERPAKDPKKMTPSDLQQYISTKVAMAGADTGVKLTQLPSETPIGRIQTSRQEPLRYQPEIKAIPPKPPQTPMVNVSVPAPSAPRSTAIPAFSISKITSDKLHATEKDAKSDALRVASRKISERLQKMDPPILVNLRAERIWNEFVKEGHVVQASEMEMEALKDSPVKDNNLKYELDVEVSEKQVQSLRAQDRVVDFAPFVFGGLIASGVVCVLLRLTGAAAAVVRNR